MLFLHPVKHVWRPMILNSNPVAKWKQRSPFLPPQEPNDMSSRFGSLTWYIDSKHVGNSQDLEPQNLHWWKESGQVADSYGDRCMCPSLAADSPCFLPLHHNPWQSALLEWFPYIPPCIRLNDEFTNQFTYIYRYIYIYIENHIPCVVRSFHMKTTICCRWFPMLAMFDDTKG